jgi:transcriptional regulator with XRE-family HTH domain
MERKRKLGDSLRRLRQLQHTSQAKVAKAIGVDIKTVQRIEGGVMLPNLSVVADIAELFGCSLDQVAGWQPLDTTEEVPVSRLVALEGDVVRLAQRGEFVDQAIHALLTALAKSEIIQPPDAARLRRLLDQVRSRLGA